MKKKIHDPQTLMLAFVCLLLCACGGSSETAYNPPYANSCRPATDSFIHHDEPPPPPVKLLFNGNFTGNANGQSFRLVLTNENDAVRGTYASKDQGYLLSGRVNGEKLTGSIKHPLGEMTFEAAYYGGNVVLQFDKETMDAIKGLAAIDALTEDDGEALVQALLAEDKIIFMPQ